MKCYYCKLPCEGRYDYEDHVLWACPKKCKDYENTAEAFKLACNYMKKHCGTLPKPFKTWKAYLLAQVKEK